MTYVDLARSSPDASYDLALVDGRSLPSAPPRGQGVEALRDDVGDVFAFVWRSGGHCFVHLPGFATFAWAQDREGVTAAPLPAVAPDAVDATFRKVVVPLRHYFAGYELLHASAVRGVAGVIGFCGQAEAGKSTLAYGLATRGFPLWADDTLAIDVSRERPVALALPFDSRLRPAARKFFDGSTPLLTDTGTEAPLAALGVVVRATGNEDVARIERLAGGRAFREVVRHAYRIGLARDHDRRRTLIESYMRIVASVPVFEIRFGAGFERFPGVLDVVAKALTAQLGRAA